MSEPKTTAIFVRLTRDFPVGQQHTRGGVTLGAGPRPIAVEVTDEQLAALEGDRYVEITSDEEAQKWEDRLGEAPAATSAEHPTATGDGDGTGRNYGDGNQNGSQGGSNDEGNEPETAEQLTKANNRDALVTLATDEGVELDVSDPKVATKAVIAEAIVAHRADNANDEE